MVASPNEGVWQAIEAIPGLAAVRAEWDQLLGGAFETLLPFLRVRPGRSMSFPAPNGGLPYEVRDCGGGEFVGVCPESGQTVELTDADLVVYELDRRRLTVAVADALRIDRAGANDFRTMPLHLGRFTSTAESQYDCFLTIPTESVDVQVVATRLIADRAAPFILFAPTRRWLRRAVEALLKSHGCAFVALSETTSMPESGRLVALRPLSTILTRLTGVVSAGAAREDETGRNVFRLEGNVWTLTFAGRTVRLRDSLGLKCLACVLAVKRVPIDVARVKAIAGGHVAVKPGEGFAPFDRRAWEACREGFTELATELAEATENNDIVRQQRIQEQMAVMAAELGSAHGLGGRERKKNDQAESMRTSVKNAIDRTLAILQKKHPELFQHLDKSVTTGAAVCYTPTPDVEWDL